MDRPYYDSEQVALKMAIDENYLDPYQEEQIEDDKRDYEQLKEDGFNFETDALAGPNPTNYDLNEQLINFNKKGGFAWAPLLSTLIPIGIDLASKLIKSKIGKGIAFDFMNQNKDGIMQLEKQLMSENPRNSFLKMREIIASMVKSILDDIGVPNSSEVANQVKQKLFSKGFIKMMEKPYKNGGKQRAISNESLMLPMLRYSLDKLTGNKQLSNKVYKQLKQNVKQNTMMSGGKISWKKVGKFFKKALKFGLPIIGNLTKKLIDSGIAKNTINSLIASKFPQLSQSGINIGDLAQKGLSLGSEVGLKEAQKALNKGSGSIKAPNKVAGAVHPPNVGGKKKSSTYKLKVDLL